jgi:hypothetical protein
MVPATQYVSLTHTCDGGVVYWGRYEALKRGLANESDSMVLTMLCGGLAGVSAYASTYPFDILKSYAHAAPAGTAAHQVTLPQTPHLASSDC